MVGYTSKVTHGVALYGRTPPQLGPPYCISIHCQHLDICKKFPARFIHTMEVWYGRTRETQKWVCGRHWHSALSSAVNDNGSHTLGIYIAILLSLLSFSVKTSRPEARPLVRRRGRSHKQLLHIWTLDPETSVVAAGVARELLAAPAG
jgi:hypothetical protein